MSKNPAKIGKSRFYQGVYVPENPKKILSDPKKLVYRSSWEKTLCLRFDRMSEIIAWGMECVVIKYRSPKDGLIHRYFTDFTIVTLDNDGNKQVTVIEVKPFKETIPPTKQGKKKSRFLLEAVNYEVNQSKWKYAREYCKQKGWNFVVMTEKEIYPKHK